MLKASRARDRSGAIFIAVTGSSGKSTTTALLAHILRYHGRVRQQLFSNMADAAMRAVSGTQSDDEFVVVEAGVGGPGEMAEIAGIVRPDIAVVTLVGLEHYSAFRGKEAVAKEKGILVEALCPEGLAVLNADDERVAEMASRSKARVVTFGEAPDADFRIVQATQSFPEQLSVTISWRNGTKTITTGLIGEYFSMSIAAAFAVAAEIGVAPDVIAEACAEFEPVQGRCQPLVIEDGPIFLVDTAKAPWETVTLPMQTVEKATASRKRVVLGQLSDYAGSSRPRYRDAYRAARAVADQVVFVGDNAHRHRASDQDRAEGRIVELPDARSLYDFLRKTAVEGELILLKSSENLHLERAALAFKHDVRCWIDKCGLKGSCLQCGMFEYPYEQHSSFGGRKKRRKRKA